MAAFIGLVCNFRFAINSVRKCGYLQAATLSEKNTNREATHTTEGFSWKLDQPRVIATVGLHSMTTGIAMWAYGRLHWVQDNCRLNPVPKGCPNKYINQHQALNQYSPLAYHCMYRSSQ